MRGASACTGSFWLAALKLGDAEAFRRRDSHDDA
jgi:hypothetical protein